MDIRSYVEEIYDEIVAIRRDIHEYPELGEEEFRTQSIVMRFLKDEGIPYEAIATTGVIGIINGEQQGLGTTVALRADMDALPIQEDVDLPFSSKVKGVMHACGHDVHTSILLGVAKTLNAMKKEFSGTIKLFFQPAEETIGGALRMVEAGCMENPKVDSVIGLHVFPRLETGFVELKYDKMNASTDTVSIEVFGKSGHGAYPHDSVDAIVIAAQIICALQTVVSRTVSPVESVVLSIGVIEGGVKSNVVADHVKMRGTLRTLDETQRVLVKKQIDQIVTYTALGLGGEAKVRFEPGYRALVNDDSIVKVIERVAKDAFGEEKVVIAKEPSLGAEDFSFFLEKAKGAFYNIGCGNVKEGYIYKGHHPKFAVDEPCIKVGIELQVKAALALLNQ